MNYRALIVRLFTFLGGIYFFLEFVLPKTIYGYEFGKYNDQISEGFVAIGALTFGLGLFNLLSIHGAKIIFLKRGWIHSAALLFGLVTATAICANDWIGDLSRAGETQIFFNLRDFSGRIVSDAGSNAAGVPKFSERVGKLVGATNSAMSSHHALWISFDPDDFPKDDPSRDLFLALRGEALKIEATILQDLTALSKESEWSEVSKAKLSEFGTELGDLGSKEQELLSTHAKYTLTKQVYSFMYDGFFVALSSAMFALLGFYIAGAGYRAFRVRSTESALMMVAAVVVMLGQIPFGLWIWGGFPELRLWILRIPNAAAFRAITFGASVAGLIMAFRMWFSIETESFGEKK